MKNELNENNSKTSKKKKVAHWNWTQVRGIGRPESQPLASSCQTMDTNNIKRKKNAYDGKKLMKKQTQANMFPMHKITLFQFFHTLQSEPTWRVICQNPTKSIMQTKLPKSISKNHMNKQQ